jgi:hypothetical protein
MKLLSKLAARRQRGTTTAFFALGMIPMVGIMALAVELGNVAVHTKRLQNYVDSKAVAELKERFGVARQNVEYHGFLNGVIPASAASEETQAVRTPGHWNFLAAPGTDPFFPTESLNLLAGRAPAYHFEVDPFEVPLLFGPLFGVPSVEIHAAATAFAPRREVVIVIDQSGSMCFTPTATPQPCPRPPGPLPTSRMAQAIPAAVGAVNAMAAQQIPGDRMAVLAFSAAPNPMPAPGPGLLDLSNPGNVAAINGFIGNLGAGGSTNIAAGLNTAYGYFGAAPTPNPEVERIVILVGDGSDSTSTDTLIFNNVSNPAAINGIDTYTVTFCGGPCGDPVNNFYQTIAAGRGSRIATATPAALGTALANIVTGVSMKLVR